MKFASFLCLAMFFCLPFSHALALNFVVCPAVILAVLLVLVAFVFIRQTRGFFSPSDFFPISLWALLTVSLGTGSMTQTAVNHWVAYTVFLLVVYFGVGRAVAALVEGDPKFFFRIAGTVSFALFFACAYGIIDWVVFLATGSEIPIPRQEGGGNGMAAGFVRARGFSGEPSGLANFILLWAPLSFWYLFQQKGRILQKTIFFLSVASAFLATFSAKGILTLVSSLPFIFIFLATKKGLNPGRILGVFLGGCILAAIVIFSGLGDVLLEVVTPKFFGSEIYEARMSRGLDVINYIEGWHWISGYGPASYVVLVGRDGDTFLSGFAYLLGDSGVLGVTIFLFFLAAQVVFIRKIPFSGLRMAFILTLYYIATGEIIAPVHYSVGFYLVVILLHVAVLNRKRIWGLPPNILKPDDYDHIGVSPLRSGGRESYGTLK